MLFRSDNKETEASSVRAGLLLRRWQLARSAAGESLSRCTRSAHCDCTGFKPPPRKRKQQTTNLRGSRDPSCRRRVGLESLAWPPAFVSLAAFLLLQLHCGFPLDPLSPPSLANDPLTPCPPGINEHRTPSPLNRPRLSRTPRPRRPPSSRWTAQSPQGTRSARTWKRAARPASCRTKARRRWTRSRP